MGLLERSNIGIGLTLHAQSTEYVPGDVLSGIVEVVVKKDVSWRGVRLRIRGEEYAKVRSGLSLNFASRVHYDKVYTLAGDSCGGERMDRAPLLLNDVDDEDGEIMTSMQRLQVGVYRYPFELELPAFLPPSFEVRCKQDGGEARMTYTVKAYVDIPFGLDAECVKKIYLLSAIPRTLYEQRMGEGNKTSLVSHAQLHSFSCLSCFCCPRAGQVIITEASLEPTIFVQDMDSVAAASGIEGANSSTICVNVKVLNDTHETLHETRVRLTNVVEIKPEDTVAVRRANLGEPFIFQENIHPGEEKAFVTFFHCSPLIPYSVLEDDGDSGGDAYRCAFSPLIPWKKQKRYVMYEQPLVNVATSFVKSCCVFSVDFPGARAKGTINDDSALLLSSTIDERNHCSKFPCVYDTMSEERKALPNNMYSSYPYLHDYAKGPEEARYVAQARSGAPTTCGIVPAYTNGDPVEEMILRK